MVAFRRTSFCRQHGQKCEPRPRILFQPRLAKPLDFCDLAVGSQPEFSFRSGPGVRHLLTDRGANMSAILRERRQFMKQRWGLIVLVAIISFLSGGWLLQRGVASDGNVYQQ